MGDIADWMTDQMIEMGNVSHSPSTKTSPVDTRSILHRFNDEAIKQTAGEMYHKGLRATPGYEAMTVDIMNRPGRLSENQRNALITYIMYAH